MEHEGRRHPSALLLREPDGEGSGETRAQEGRVVILDDEYADLLGPENAAKATDL